MYGYSFNKIFKTLDSDSTPTPAALGDLFNIDFTTLSDLNDFTEVNSGGSSYLLDSGYLKISGNPSNSFGLNALMFDNWVTGLENWTLTMDYVIKDHAAANAGITVTFKQDSSVGTTRADSFVHYRRSGNAADGDGYRYFNDSSVLTPNAFSSNPLVAGGTITVDDTYRMTLTRSSVGGSARFTLKIENLDNPEENEGFLEYDYSNTSGQLDMSSSKLGIGTIGGTHWVTNLTLSSTDQKNVDYVVIGDSMTAGYCTTALTDRWLDEVRVANPSLTFTKTACQNDGADTAVNKNTEISTINASKAIIWIGTNQAVQESSGAALASFATLMSNLNSAGISESDCIIINALPRGGDANIIPFNTGLSSTYTSATIIDAYSEADDAGSPGNIKAIYSCGDGVHGNDAFNTWISGQINSIL